MAYFQNGGTASSGAATIDSNVADVSAIEIINAGTFTISGPVTADKTGDTSSLANSASKGQNAAVLATSGSTIAVEQPLTITTDGAGASGVFATGTGSVIQGTSVFVTTRGYESAGTGATLGGTVNLTIGSIATSGAYSAGVLTDGAGTMDLQNTTVQVTGANSVGADIQSVLKVTGGSISSAQGAGLLLHPSELTESLIEDASLTGTTGVIVQAGTASGGFPNLAFDNASLIATAGDAVDVNGANADIEFHNHSSVATSTGILLDATNTALVDFEELSQTLTGTITQDSTSNVYVQLDPGSTLAGQADVTQMLVIYGSIWDVGGISQIGTLTTSPGMNGEYQGLAVMNGATLTAATATATIVTQSGSTNSITIDAGTTTIDANGTDHIDLGTGHATIFASGAATVVNGTGDLVLITGATAETFAAGAGHDTVFAGTGGGAFVGGSGGGNILIASTGNTTLTGAVAGDALYAGTAGQDLLIAGSSGEVLVAGGGNDTLIGGAGSELMYGNNGTSEIFGSTGGHDTIVGGSGSTVVVATANDDVFAGTGHTTVYGSQGGGDIIFGDRAQMYAVVGNGGGTVYAGSGSATVYAGLGHDVFHVVSGLAGGSEIIHDFQNGTDQLNFSGYAPGAITQTVANGNTVFTLSDHTVITLLGIDNLSPSAVIHS